MSSNWTTHLKRFLLSWQAPALASGVILLALVIWLMPRRIERVVPVDRSTSWNAEQAPPRREIVWEPAEALSPKFSQSEPSGEFITPRLADRGTTLYFTRRHQNRQSDIYRSQYVDGSWQPAEPVAVLNTSADEIGPVLGPERRRIYFYSDRDGGQGGYDLYVATRTDSGWSEPKNLGPEVNTTAHEYDPAIAPDGLTLYFASNRTQERQQTEKQQDKTARQWTTTLRHRPGRQTFDLYRTRRNGLDDDWQSPEPLSELNLPKTNEGAPFVAPNGAFLYFASDRPSREGEDRNLDLYRVRLDGGKFHSPENLGPSINTAANETEPALSPTGFTLVFSSNRSGKDRLYRSTAEEVFHDAYWDTSHAEALGDIWWQAILLTLLLLALLAALLYYRGWRDWLSEAVWASRFFLGSLLLHLLLLLLLAYWTLPQVIQYMVEKPEDPVPATEILDDNQHQSRETGEKAYEKMADLKSVEQKEIPEQVRQETEPVSVPKRTERLQPTVTAAEARRLPPEKVLSVPPRRSAPDEPPQRDQQPEELTQRELSRPNRPVEVAEAPPEMTPEPAETPAEEPVRRNVQVNRQQPTSSSTTVEPRRPRQSTANEAVARATPSPVEPVTPAAESPPKQPTEAMKLASRTPASPNDVQPAEVPQEEVAVPTSAEQIPTEAPLNPAETTVARRRTAANSNPRISRPAVQQMASTETPQPSAVALEAAATAEPTATESAASSSAELAKAVPRQSTVAPSMGVPSTEESVAVEAQNAPAELSVKPNQVALARRQAVSPQPGHRQNNPTETTDASPRARPAAAPAELKAMRAETEPAETAKPTENPLARRSSRPNTQQAAEVDEEIQLAEAAIQQVEQATNTTANLVQPDLLRMARRSSQGPAPRKAAPAETQPAQLADATEARPSELREQSRPELQSEGNTQPSEDQLARAETAPAQVQELNDAETEAPDLAQLADSVPSQKPVPGTEVALNRTESTLPKLNVRTPKEMTGPASRAEHRIVVGSLSEKRNEAPPALAPKVSRLSRKRAKATPVAMAEDNVGMESLFTLRQGDTRKKYIKLFGGTDESEAAVNRGLNWLAAHQHPNGHWSLNKFHETCQGDHKKCSGAGNTNSDTAGTGLALLPFLAAGHTHQSGKYQEVVADGVGWLLEHQKSNGDLFVPGQKQTWMYSHGIASIALCEAYGMTQDPNLKGPAQQALKFIRQAQHKGSGGWRYRPNESADTSVVGWQMMALKSGEMAGLPVPKQTYEHVKRWLKSVESDSGGRFGYRSGGSSPAMTAEGLLCLQFTGLNRDHPRMLSGADYLMKHLPRKDQDRTSYYWYYAMQVMYHMQGKYWEAWNAKLRDLLVKTQKKQGNLSGTWKPQDRWEKRGGRIYATAMKLLILEVYYRHLPLYEQLETGTSPAASG